MKIQWLGHSAFRLEESTGTVIVTDPYHPNIGREMPRIVCDAVTVSHEHYDHNYIDAFANKPAVIKSQGIFEVKGVHVRSLMSHHDEVAGKKRGKNLIFQFRMDGVEVCHMGDIGEPCSTRLVEALVPVNILLIPVGGTYTIDAEQAKEYVDRIMPDIVIPMHFKTRDINIDIDKAYDFLDLFDKDDIVYTDSDSIEFDRFDFDGESTKVIVFKDMTD